MAERMNNLNGKEWLQESFSIWRDIRKSSEERKIKHPAMFPVQLCEKLIKIYTKNDGDIILDPFMGIGSTLVAAKNLNKKGIGIDLNPEFFKITKQRISQQQTTLTNNPSILFKSELYLGDAKEELKKIPDESIDLCINSPPYWDILNRKRTVDKKNTRNYSKLKEDVGNISEYKDFLKELKNIYSEVYRTLKVDKRCCVIVMDIRKKSKFYPLHIDITRIMEEIGFELEEFVIWDRQHEYNNMKTLGYPWVFRFNKVHEFVCIFWKRTKK
ncbi:MAG: DNA methyltransferase [Candidatus Firestonebacteria bacterium]